MRNSKLRDKIRTLLNEESAEMESDTPDFILAEFVEICLHAFDLGVNKREVWYGRPEEEVKTDADN